MRKEVGSSLADYPLTWILEKARMARPAVGRPKLVAGRKVAKISSILQLRQNRAAIIATRQNAVILHPAVRADVSLHDQGFRMGGIDRQLKWTWIAIAAAYRAS